MPGSMKHPKKIVTPKERSPKQQEKEIEYWKQLRRQRGLKEK